MTGDPYGLLQRGLRGSRKVPGSSCFPAGKAVRLSRPARVRRFHIWRAASSSSRSWPRRERHKETAHQSLSKESKEHGRPSLARRGDCLLTEYDVPTAGTRAALTAIGTPKKNAIRTILVFNGFLSPVHCILPLARRRRTAPFRLQGVNEPSNNVGLLFLGKKGRSFAPPFIEAVTPLGSDAEGLVPSRRVDQRLASGSRLVWLAAQWPRPCTSIRQQSVNPGERYIQIQGQEEPW